RSTVAARGVTIGAAVTVRTMSVGVREMAVLTRDVAVSVRTVAVGAVMTVADSREWRRQRDPVAHHFHLRGGDAVVLDDGGRGPVGEGDDELAALEDAPLQIQRGSEEWRIMVAGFLERQLPGEIDGDDSRHVFRQVKDAGGRRLGVDVDEIE